MRSTYARVRARWLRWKEEIQLLLEEMRRGPVFLLWKANWWKERADARPEVAFVLQSGLRAYAFRQSRLFSGMAVGLVRRWASIVAKNSLTVEWPLELRDLALGTLPTGPVSGGVASNLGPPADAASLISPPIIPSSIHQLNLELQADQEEDSSTDEDGITAGAETDGYESAF